MPYYEYQCNDCHEVFEIIQTGEEHDQHIDHDQHQALKCPHCGSQEIDQRYSSVYVVTSKKS